MVLPVLAAVGARILGSAGAKVVANQVGKSVIANTARSEATGLTMGRSVGQLQQGMDTARQVANTARSISSTVSAVKQLGQAFKPLPQVPQVDYKEKPASQTVFF